MDVNINPCKSKKRGTSMSKKAIIVVSFGTTYTAAQKAIKQIEQKLADAFQDYDFYRAFTSKCVIRKLAQNQGIYVETPLELLEKLHNQGYEEILCQSLHVINGIEYDYMIADLQKYVDKFKEIKIGKPLLTCEEDYITCAEFLGRHLPTLEDDEAIILMGHGTEHFANGAYCQLENTFHYLGHENVYVGTVEGFPALDYVLKEICQKSIRRIYLTPFMIVAGDHAQVDLAGDGEEAWKTILEKSGYQVEVIMRGLGEYEEIGDLFVAHCVNATKL